MRVNAKMDKIYITKKSHHTRGTIMITKSVLANKYKSTLNCVDGYQGIELAEVTKTNFSTE